MAMFGGAAEIAAQHSRNMARLIIRQQVVKLSDVSLLDF